MIESRDTRPERRPPTPTLTQALGGRCSTLVDCIGVGAIVSAAWVQPAAATLTLTWQQLLFNGFVGFMFGAALPVLAYVCAVAIRRWWCSLLPVAAAGTVIAFVCWQAFNAAWGFPGLIDLLCGALVLAVTLLDWGMARRRAWCGRRPSDSAKSP